MHGNLSVIWSQCQSNGLLPTTNAPLPKLIHGVALFRQIQLLLSLAHMAAPEELAADNERLKQVNDALEARLALFEARLQQVERDQPLSFTVGQYNILASYLGNNTEPWFLYGCPTINDEKRKRVKAQHNQGRDDKAFRGFENYARGVLSAEEQKQVLDFGAQIFAWEKRREKVVAAIQALDADILSLVELDTYKDFADTFSSGPMFYASAFQKRPRESSPDGCAIFWRRTKFVELAQRGFIYNDTDDR